MSFIIEVQTDTGFSQKEISYIKIAKLGAYVCGTYDLITTSFIEQARKFKTKQEAQNFIDKVEDKIEDYETLLIKEFNKSYAVNNY
jgi:hypothetical protein